MSFEEGSGTMNGPRVVNGCISNFSVVRLEGEGSRKTKDFIVKKSRCRFNLRSDLISRVTPLGSSFSPPLSLAFSLSDPPPICWQHGFQKLKAYTHLLSGEADKQAALVTVEVSCRR